MKDEQYDGLILHLRSINDQLESLKQNTAENTDPWTPNEIEGLIDKYLDRQNQVGPSVRTTIDWNAAWRIVFLQLLVVIAIAIFYGIANSGP